MRSLKERAQGRLKVSIAEIGNVEDPRYATFGVAVVSSSSRVCDQVLASVASMAGSLPDAIMTDRATEIVPFGEGGGGVRGGIEQALDDGMDEEELS